MVRSFLSDSSVHSAVSHSFGRCVSVFPFRSFSLDAICIASCSLLHCSASVYWTTKYWQRSNDVPLQYTLDAMLWLSRAFNFNLLPPNEHTYRRWFLTWLMITSCFICHYIETHCIPKTVKMREASDRDKNQTPFDSMYRTELCVLNSTNLNARSF